MKAESQASPNSLAVHVGEKLSTAAEIAISIIVKEAVLAAREDKRDMLRAAASSIKGVIRAGGSGGADIAGVTKVALNSAVDVCVSAGCDRVATFSAVRKASIEIADVIGGAKGGIVRKMVEGVMRAAAAIEDVEGHSQEAHAIRKEHS